MSLRSISLVLFLALAAASARAQTASAANPAGTVVLDRLVVTDQLDQAREALVPSLGATSYLVTSQQIETVAQGTNAPFNQILLRVPGVAADSAPSGGVHVRGEHANLQYRINDVLLPEGISGFGVEFDPQFIDSLQLVTGALPAQYGFRTAGVVDIHTRNGALADGGEVAVYGGSHGTINPGFAASGSSGPASYFFSGSYNHNDLGIENPTDSATAIHDTTDQWKLFSYISRLLDSGSRVSVMLSGSGNDFQVPNTPGLPPGTSPNGDPWVPGTFDSAQLDENQRERNYYGIVTYQKSTADLNYQLSAFARESDVHFLPDPVGDLYFNGVASDVNRRLRSLGLQADGSYSPVGAHTLRGGGTVLTEWVSADTITTVFPVDADGNPTGPSFPIAHHDQLRGTFAGVYLQDEWRLSSTVTLNYGARFDVFSSSFDDEKQLSPRVGLVWQPTADTTLHAGYARYFTPPAVENTSRDTVALFDGTSNAAAVDQDDPVRAERAHYFDVGVSHKLAPGLQVGVDAYYKRATNQLDDGLFGQTLILSSFNYADGEIYGVEFTTSYTRGGFSAYANFARSQARGKEWNSAQFLFDPADLAYVHDHWIYLDHDQKFSGSAGVSYRWKQGPWSTLLCTDVIHGSGLRNDAMASDGSTIPNGASVPSYTTLNLGVARGYQTAHGEWQARLDVVNVTDESYQLRDGSGVGVNAAQYGARRGFFGSVSYKF